MLTKRRWRRARGKIIAKYPGSLKLRRVAYKPGKFDDIIRCLLYPNLIAANRIIE